MLSQRVVAKQLLRALTISDCMAVICELGTTWQMTCKSSNPCTSFNMKGVVCAAGMQTCLDTAFTLHTRCNDHNPPTLCCTQDGC